MKVSVMKTYGNADGIMYTISTPGKDAAQYLYDCLADSGLVTQASHSSTSDSIQVQVHRGNEDELFRLISTMEPPQKVPGNPVADNFWKSMCDMDATLKETRDLAILYLADCIPCSAEPSAFPQFVRVNYRGVQFTAELCFAHEDSQVLIYPGNELTDYTARHLAIKKGDDLRDRFSRFFEELREAKAITPAHDCLPPDDRLAKLEDTVARLASRCDMLEAVVRDLQNTVRAK